ncbi:LytR/AlgR family response regulator transcription factor [Pseudoalteromonas tetraodonis]|jgi:DNA-binding LytR/AlgR family response regulator|uniref:DNA-binding response regulator n=1 Tax=Pseudoalteromonas tetraodonis TaxID=43659 RepID=A0ABD4EMG4_9GAMM|nr:LytTR family DNA-binding domain-containing protein [Pseudoalteromonas spiralis]KYL34526.1 DNA-binding response regulator [Pseudoalteromonas spiralis]
MKVVIIEDEPLAAQKLSGYITRYSAECEVIKVLTQVAEVIDYLQNDPEVDLIFSDIELLDGEVFSAFDEIDLPCPIVFTTSYNEFWTQAFDNQGVAYLLKPFTYKRFANAMSNYEQLKSNLVDTIKPNAVATQRYKSRFFLKKGQVVDILKTEDVVCIRATSGVLSAYDNHGKHHLLTGNSMTELEAQLDPSRFFRVNRSEIVNINYVLSFESYAKETLAVNLQHMSEPLITSKTRTSDFRKWLAT